MIHPFDDLIEKPVRVRTVTNPTPKGFMTLLDGGGGSLTLENEPGEVFVIPWTSVLSIEVDYAAARSEGWHEPVDHPSYDEARRNLFKAERGQRVGLKEDVIDTDALAAEWWFRGYAARHPDHPTMSRMQARARVAAVGERDDNVDDSVKTGPIDTLNYRRAADHQAKLASLLTARRPEDEVAPRLTAVALHAGNALSKYPNHAELRGWFDGVESLRKKLGEKVRKDNGIDAPFVPGDAARHTGLYAAE